MAELADARDLKSLGFHNSYRFDSGSRHQTCVVSSGGEHYLDTVGVSSSNLLRRTIFMPIFRVERRQSLDNMLNDAFLLMNALFYQEFFQKAIEKLEIFLTRNNGNEGIR